MSDLVGNPKDLLSCVMALGDFLLLKVNEKEKI